MIAKDAAARALPGPVNIPLPCPKCRTPMGLTTLMGIAVEKCPSCEGVFFDRGEIEKLVRRNVKWARLKARALFWRS